MVSMMGRKMGQIMVICLMAIMSTRSSALRDSRSIADRLKPIVNDPEDNKLPMKKAYTYVSEYKRLPVFNFGIGKRWTDGSRSKGAQPYSFGFGKRSTSANLYPIRFGLDYSPYENYMNDDMSADTREPNKRNGRVRLYDFGFGKRMAPSQPISTNFANNNEDFIDVPKNHLNDDLEQRFLYGLTNRFTDDQEVQEED